LALLLVRVAWRAGSQQAASFTSTTAAWGQRKLSGHMIENLVTANT
jgi:hypothetical protein